MTPPVEAAIAHLKGEAMTRAQIDAIAQIGRIIKIIEEHGWDVEKAAPYPNSNWRSREEYITKRARYNIFRRLTKSKNTTGCRKMNDPDFVEVSPINEATFVNEAIDRAAIQYDAFVAKLVGKIGDCDTATLSGSHVWGYSILTVTKGSTVERWKTQQIVNVSKLGLLFNQWPSRKMK